MVFVAVVRRRGPESRSRLLSVGLAAAALIYLVFAIAAGGGMWIPVELLLAVSFSLMAFSTQRSALLLGVAWLLHVGWDAMHMCYLEAAVALAWYPPLCIGFDLVVAAYLFSVGLLSRTSPVT